jgi:hypothetical protein
MFPDVQLGRKLVIYIHLDGIRTLQILIVKCLCLQRKAIDLQVEVVVVEIIVIALILGQLEEILLLLTLAYRIML